MKVKFLKSPTGKYNLAYAEGSTAVIDGEKYPIDEMVKDGYITVIAEKAVEQKETRTTRSKKRK